MKEYPVYFRFSMICTCSNLFTMRYTLISQRHKSLIQI